MAATQDESQMNIPAATLHILLRDGTLVEREIGKAETTIGKAPHNDILLADPSVSGSHAMIRYDGERFTLNDMGSRNGTFINDARVTDPMPLNHGDLVRMGHCTLTFRLNSVSDTLSSPRTVLLADEPPPPPVAPPAPQQVAVTEDALAKALVANGMVQQEQIDRLRGTGSRGRRLCHALVEDKLVTELGLRDLISRTFNIKPVDLNSAEIDSASSSALKSQFLRERLVCPVSVPGADKLTLAVFDPTDAATIEEVERVARKKISVRLAMASEIAMKLDQHFTPRLIGVTPAGEKIQAILNNVETEIGKAAHNRLVISDPTVSTTHAIVLARDGGYSIVDLGSSNGTFINGKKLGSESHTLQHGDKIQLGQIVLTFRNPAETTEHKTARLSLEALEEIRRRAGGQTVAAAAVPQMPTESHPAPGEDEEEHKKKKKKKKAEADKNSWRSPANLSRIVAQVLASLIGLGGLFWVATRDNRTDTQTPAPISNGGTVLDERPVRLPNAEWEKISTGFFGKKVEASGVIHATNQNGVMFVSDDRTNEVLWMPLNADGVQAGTVSSVPLGVTFTDPEAITYGNSYYYLVTSQSNPRDGTNNAIVRFDFNPATMTLRGKAEIIPNLRSWLLTNVTEISSLGAPAGDKDGLNIEGLAWDPNNERLLLGLRSPMIGNQAVLVPLRLKDPRGAFNLSNLMVDDPRVIVLPLEGQGVRDITYDGRLKDFLIISGAPETAPRSEFTLWLWTGRPDAKPVKILKLEDDMKPEGITSLSINGKDFIIVVGDSGQYLKLEYGK